jgi:hypothetical protein
MALQTVTLTSTVPSSLWTVPSKCFLVNAFLVGGGGGGGTGNGTTNGGGGGGGGRVRYVMGISVTPGGTVTYTLGSSGAASSTGGTTTFGSTTVAGGAAGGTGTGGASSSLIISTTTARTGGTASGTGGGGAGSGDNGIGGASGGFGGNGYIFNGTSYGGGGGGGGPTFSAASARPVVSAYGGNGGGGRGGSEGQGAPGTANTGGGGGGGSAGGTLTSKGTLPSYNNSPAAPNLTLAAQSGGAGGTGLIILQYDEAVFTITTSAPGVAEGSPITITLSTRNVANGAVLPYTITGVAAADFSPASLTGNFTISSIDGGITGTASVTLTIAADSTTEGNETAVISLNNGFASKTFTVGDSSITSGPAVILSKKIQMVDYNTIQSDVASVMGVGAADYGYGQTLLSSQVNENTRVTVNEWGNLRYDIINAWVHQFGSLPSPVTAVEGQLVKANSGTSPYTSYRTFASVLVANRFGVHSSQAITRTGPSAGVFWNAQQTWPGVYGASWTTKIQSTVTVTFTTANKARAFFNSGSEIRFISSISGGAASQQNASWNTLLNSVGTVAFGGIKPSPVTEPNDGQNYYRLSSTFQYFYTASSTSPYSANIYRIAARTPSVSDNSAGTANTIEFLVEWLDSHPGAAAYDSVDGTITLSANTLEASGTLRPSGTGTFSVETPTITVGAITP